MMAAVAQRGFQRLQLAMLQAMQSGQGRQGLKGVATSYVKFALDNPTEYRLMFGSELAVTDDLPSLRETSRAVLGFVAEGISQLQAAGMVGAGDPQLMAAATWSMLHGLAILVLDGQTAGVAPDVDALVEESTRIMMFGMAGRPS
jgi:AcrR family transcriptional regulator